MLNRLNEKKIGGNMVVSALLTVIIGWILVAFYFWYFGQSLDKNDVTKVSTDLRQNLTDVAAQVRNGADITLNNQSVLNNLVTQYDSKAIILRKWMTATGAFASGTDLSGTTLSWVVAGINNGTKYLVLDSNASLTNNNTGYVLDWTSNIGLTAANHSADAAGLTYKAIYFLVPASDKATFDKIAEANIGRVSVGPETTLQDGSTTANAVLVHLSNVGEQ